jgi:hypothetical protein
MKYTLVLEEKDLNIILINLINGAYKVVAPVLTDIQKQVDEQNKSIKEEDNNVGKD